MTDSKQYGYPHIPLSKLRKLRNRAEVNFFEYRFDEKDLWHLLIRQEIDRLLLEEIQTNLRNAKNYRGVEGYACPLCEYENGVFVRYCALHQKIEEQAEELEKLRAIVEMYETSSYVGTTEWVGPSGKSWKIDWYDGDEDAD